MFQKGETAGLTITLPFHISQKPQVSVVLAGWLAAAGWR
jgi:hypothetical protein